MTPNPRPLLWSPTPDQNARTEFARYLAFLARTRGLHFGGYLDTWAWSAAKVEDFWASVWDFFDIRASAPYATVLPERRMPGADWFPGARLNYAEHAFRHATSARPALLSASELRPLRETSWDELQRQVASVAASLRDLGVRAGDRVVACLPNVPEAVVALLACASVGAIWSACSPDFGAQGALDRFRQIEPKVLIAVDGYRYAGRDHDRIPLLEALRAALPTLTHTVLLPYLDPQASLPGAIPWATLLERPDAGLTFEPLPFSHPLWVLYSSGTTGPPKAIVHGHGGILLEHLKALALQCDVKPEDRVFWFTTTGWMMWNLQVGGLLAGATCVLYDGSPNHPDPTTLWRLVEQARVTRFGASAAFLTRCMKAGLRPGERFGLTALRALGSTGSPLPPEAFRWVYDAVKPDLWLSSTSGGTDVCSAFLSACPMRPVREGELQGPALGVALQSFDPAGRPLTGEVGELVVTQPMPSMPLRFWNDPGDARYRESYFEAYPGVWRHGDWLLLTEEMGAVIHGRSDATLNRLGVRIGTSEIYRAVEAVPEVIESVVLGMETADGYRMPLFVVLREGLTLDDPLAQTIRAEIRTRSSPRHVPDEIVQVPALPRTLSGKKLEVPLRRILMGEPPARVVDPASLANPEALDFFVRWARQAETLDPKGRGAGDPTAAPP